MEPQYEFNFAKYGFREKYNLPVEFRDIVCSCEKMTYDRFLRTGTCVACNKPPTYFLHRCIYCQKIFLQDFGWPFWCAVDAACWDCSNEYVHEFCKRHPPMRPEGREYFEPLGWNPKTFTEEDLKDVFDF